MPKTKERYQLLVRSHSGVGFGDDGPYHTSSTGPWLVERDFEATSDDQAREILREIGIPEIPYLKDGQEYRLYALRHVIGPEVMARISAAQVSSEG